MARARRTRPVLRRVVLGLCLLLILAFLASLRWAVVVSIWETTITLANGGVIVLWWSKSDPGISVYDSLFVHDMSAAQLCWWPSLDRGLFPWSRVAGFTFPIWMIVVAVAVIARLLPYLARRIPPDHCQHCGYNLTGNVSGICPECGTATEREGEPT